MLTCIRCNQVLDKGEKFCHLCGGVGVAVSQNIRQMPEQKRDTASQMQREREPVLPWVILSSLLHYFATLSIGVALWIAHAAGVRSHAFPRFSRRTIEITPVTFDRIILFIVLMLVGLMLAYLTSGIREDQGLVNAGFRLHHFQVGLIVTTSIITPIALLTTELGVVPLVVTAIVSIGTAMIMPDASKWHTK